MDRSSAPHRAVNWGQFMLTGTSVPLHSLPFLRCFAGISCHAVALLILQIYYCCNRSVNMKI